jgi:hypothetical protein
MEGAGRDEEEQIHGGALDGVTVGCVSLDIEQVVYPERSPVGCFLSGRFCGLQFLRMGRT